MNRIHAIIALLSLALGVAAAGAAEQEPADLTDHYLILQTALAADSLEGVADHAAALADLADDIDRGSRLAAAAQSLAAAEDLAEAREAFAHLSALMIRDSAVLARDDVKIAYCPMADHSWLQTGEKIANPYYGSQMLRCGRFVEQADAASR